MKRLRRPVSAVLLLLRLLLALLILFEEWGWEPLRRALIRLGRLAVMRRIEAAVARLSPPAALAVLLLPTLGLLPVKLLALWLIARGAALAGLVVIVVAKLLGTAVLAWLFTRTQPALRIMVPVDRDRSARQPARQGRTP